MGNYFSKCIRVNSGDQTNDNTCKKIETEATAKDANPTPISSWPATGMTNQGHIDAPNLTNSVISGDNNTITVNVPPNIVTPLQDRIEFNFQDCVPTFTGREGFIEDVHETIAKIRTTNNNTSPIRAQTIVIIGMAGVGKTQAVRRYIQLYKKSYDHVFWVNAESYSEATSCFVRLAERIPIEITYNGKKMADGDIIDKIYDFICQKVSLIVYDNVGSFKTDDNKDGLHLLLPRAVKTGWKVPIIIVTTRNRNWTDFTFKELKCFDLSESVVLISVLEFEDNRDLVQEVASLCQGLPLALQQVISFVRTKLQIRAFLDEEPYTLKDFLTDVASNKKEFISTEPPESASLDVFTIFQMTFEQIVTMKFGELALQCLDIMSILNPDNIPTVLIKACFTHAQMDLGQALRLLHSNNLVTRCDSFYQVHRMVQAVKIESLNMNSSKLKYERVDWLKVVESILEFLGNMPINSAQVHEILNNIVRIYDQVSPDNYTKPFLLFQATLARTLRQVGSYTEAIRLLREAVQKDEEVWGIDHTFTVKSKTYLAKALREDGRYDEAEKIYSGTLDIEIKALGPDHPDTLGTKHNLAGIFTEQGKYDKARELYSDGLKKCMKIRGNDHHETLGIKHSLAGVLKIQGESEEAKKLYNDVLEHFVKKLGPDHPDTLGTKNNLAGVLEQQGKYAEAENLLNDVLEAQIKILGPEHPHTLGTKQNLAVVLVNQGKNEEAQTLSKELLGISIKILGPNHPGTLRTKHNLAAVLQNQGKYEAAQEIYSDVLENHIKIFGNYHPDTISTKHNLAAVLDIQGKYSDAQNLYIDVVEASAKALGIDHPNTLRAKHYLAAVLQNQGKYKEAEDIYSTVLNMRIKILGVENPATLSTKHNLAVVLVSQMKCERAQILFSEVLKMQNKILGQKHPDTINTMQNLAASFVNEGKYKEAQKLYTDVLEISLKILGPEHPDTLRTKHNLASVLQNQGKFEEAQKLFNDVLEKRMTTLGPEHPRTLKTKQNLDVVLLCQCKKI